MSVVQNNDIKEQMCGEICLWYRTMTSKNRCVESYVWGTEQWHQRTDVWRDMSGVQNNDIKEQMCGELCLWYRLVGFLTSSSTTRLYRGRAPRQERLTILRAATHETELGDHGFCFSRSHYTDTDPTSTVVQNNDIKEQRCGEICLGYRTMASKNRGVERYVCGTEQWHQRTDV